MVEATQLHQTKKSDMQDVLILDTGSTIDATIMNPDLITNLHKSKTKLHMSTNAGSKEIHLKGTMPGFGEAWYDDSMMANIIGFSSLADKSRITYDSDVKDAFMVHTKDGVVEFARRPDGLYGYTPSEHFKRAVAKTKNPVAMLQTGKEVSPAVIANAVGHLQLYVATIKENMQGFTAKEIKGAKEARALYHKVGCPSFENFKNLIRSNQIRNCPVTVQDVINWEKIFGPDVATLKGKTTRKKTPAVIDDEIEIPDEIKERDDLILCIDIAYVCGKPYLVGIDTTIRHRFCVPLKNRKNTELFRALDIAIRPYNKAGYTIKEIHCDQEFKHMMDQVSDEMDVETNHTSTGEHANVGERNIRTTKERIRVSFHSVPFKAWPKEMLDEACQLAVDQLNFFPAKGGVSPYYSPNTIITGKVLDYKKHLKHAFGTYVQAFTENDPSNTHRPRTYDAIYMRPSDNRQGGHRVLDLRTGKVITRAQVTALPMPEWVIARVEKLAKRDGIKELKVQSRAGWIAGVDSDSDSDSDSSDSDSDSDSSDSDDEVPELGKSRWDSDSDSDSESSSDSSDSDDDWDDYEPMDRDELMKLKADARRQVHNPADDDDSEPEREASVFAPEDASVEQGDAAPAGVSVSDADSQGSEPRRSARERQAPQVLTYNAPGKPNLSQSGKTKAVNFDHKVVMKDLEQCHNMVATESNCKTIEYEGVIAGVAARFIHEMNERPMVEGKSMAQQYILQKGLKLFGKRGETAALKEVGQLHDRVCFKPLDVVTMTPEEKRKAQEAIMFLCEKRDLSVKARMVYNGKPTREWHDKEDTASPTTSTESVFLTSTVNAKEERDVMSTDIPNAFIQALMPKVKDGEARVTMKLSGVLLELLVQLAPEIYGPYVVLENGKRVLYLQVLRALYGMLQSALLWYRRFRGDLEGQGFVFNPYDPCVCNRMIDGKQHTVMFHVDDLMSSHVDANVNTKFLAWLNALYGKHGEVKATRGKVHDYLGMTIDFSVKGKVIVSMKDYMCKLVDEFPFKISGTEETPAAEDLLSEGTGPKLDKEKAKIFHTWVAKALFACKRARPDISPTTTVLCTRVKEPNESDWKKLIRLLKYVNGSRDDVLTLSADDLHVLKWYVDASFAVHPDFKSHTGACFTYGGGSPITMSKKQKLNTKSSTESELVGVDDAATMILWTKLFLEAQGYKINKNVVYQDNKSAILLEKNGKRSSSKRTRHLNIRYFFVTDQIEKGNMCIEYCPTGEMVADFMTKPLQGKLFAKMKKLIMGG